MMKGSLKTKTIFEHNLQNKTNFNDWSDPKSKPLIIRNSRNTTVSTSEDFVETEEEVTDNLSQTSVLIENLRSKIRGGYPLLSKKEIRNVKLPFYESLLLNLKEDGFFATFEFIKDLIALDDEWQKMTDENFKSKNRPFLKSDVSALNSLCGGLTKAEVAKRERNTDQEVRSLLDLAIHFSKPEDESWHWLAEELFEQCVSVDVDSDSTPLNPQLEAIAKYIFATFLMCELHDLDRAKHYVEESMKLAVGKNWNVCEVTGKKHDALYFESCLLLHNIFLEMAHEKRHFEIQHAIQLCRYSLQWAKQTNHKSAEARALLNLAEMYISAKQPNPVLGHLERYMKLCEEENDVEGICKGFICLATFHELMNQDDLVIEDIQKLLKIAEEGQIMEMMAKGHCKLAKFYLMQSKEKKMQQHATRAYNYYVILDKKPEMEETRCLTAIAQAHEVMPQYLDLLLEAKHLETSEFKILMFWKTLRIPFFSNVKLYQPEADINLELKDRVEILKNEDIQATNLARKADMSVPITSKMSKFSINKTEGSLFESSMSNRQMSRNVADFHRQIRESMTDLRNTGSRYSMITSSKHSLLNSNY